MAGVCLSGKALAANANLGLSKTNKQIPSIKKSEGISVSTPSPATKPGTLHAVLGLPILGVNGFLCHLNLLKGQTSLKTQHLLLGDSSSKPPFFPAGEGRLIFLGSKYRSNSDTGNEVTVAPHLDHRGALCSARPGVGIILGTVQTLSLRYSHVERELSPARTLVLLLL